MKVTLIGTLPPVKALSPYCFHLAGALSRKTRLEFINFYRIMPECLYCGGTTEKDISSPSIKNVEIRNLLRWYNPLSWVKAGLGLRGDVLHVQHWALYASLIYCIVLPLAKLRGKKIVLSVHNITPHVSGKLTGAIDRLLNAFLFSFGDCFIVHNKRNKDKLIALYNIPDTTISIIGHGVLQPYSRRKGISKRCARNHVHVPLEKKVILFFGYIWGYKGLDVLLQALPLVKQSVPDVLLLIAGQALSDWKTYEKLIETYQLHDVVLCKLTYVSDAEVESYFSCADVVVLPYKSHPFDTHGGVGALALSFHTPLLVTDVGGLPSYVKDDWAIVTPGDVHELAHKIIHLLSDERLRQKLSDDAVHLAKELDWNTIADRTIEVYQKLLSP